jgi:hypothetical protein
MPYHLLYSLIVYQRKFFMFQHPHFLRDHHIKYYKREKFDFDILMISNDFLLMSLSGFLEFRKPL